MSGPMALGSVTPERLLLAAEVKRLRDDRQLLWREIADRFGISRTYAQSLYVDPDGAKARERKDSYRGTCDKCGNQTTGAYGRRSAPTLCASCVRAEQHASRRWTREAVIDAIQRFAAANGRPPRANEWITADPVNGYPPRSAVYGNRIYQFKKWSDAIVAAGFPRPLPYRGRRPGRRRSVVKLNLKLAEAIELGALLEEALGVIIDKVSPTALDAIEKIWAAAEESKAAVEESK